MEQSLIADLSEVFHLYYFITIQVYLVIRYHTPVH